MADGSNMERMGASLERTIRNAADYLTELDCIQQTVEVECDKIQRRLASTRHQELEVTSMLRGHRHYKYCMLYMAKLYADMALFLEQQYLAEGGSPGGCDWQQVGRFFRTLYQVTLEVAFVYLKEAQVACGSTAITSSALGGRGDSRAVLISLSREDQDAYFPLLWRLCSRPYETFLDELAKNGSEERCGLSRAITKISLVDDDAGTTPADYRENIGVSSVDTDNPIPAAFVAFVHHHIALLAPFFLKRRQRLVTQSPDHLAPHTYLQKALDIILETLQDALYNEMCAGQYHQKFLQSTDFLAESEHSVLGRDMTSLMERYRKPVRTVKQFLADCNDAVNARLNALYHKFRTQCSCGRLFHVCVE